MSRVKTFDSTGLATAGRLYAGDLNLIQDQYADLVNYSQTHGVGTLAVGDATIQLLKYGTAEARLTAAFRTDGIMRGLGGFVAGAFTTAQRDAIGAGFRPYGLVILNTQTNRLEYNAGTDGSPNWQPLHSATGLVNADIAAAAAIAVSKLAAGSNGQVITTVAGVPTWSPLPSGVETGTVLPWPGPQAEIPSGYLACNGAEYAQATYPTLYTRLGGASTVWNTFSGLPAPGAGNFRVPDLRGLFMLGNRGMTGGPTITGSRVARAAASILGSLFGEEYVTLALTEIPAHNHGGATGTQSADHTHSGSTGNVSADHSHSGTTAGRNAAHVHYDSGHAHDSAGSTNNGGDSGANVIVMGYNTFGDKSFLRNGYANLGTESADHAHGFSTGGISANHTHAFSTGGASASHTHSVSNAGGGGAHENVPPAAVLNFMIKT